MLCQRQTKKTKNCVKSNFVVLDILCNNSLSHFAIPDALCNNFLSHFDNCFLSHSVITVSLYNNNFSYYLPKFLEENCTATKFEGTRK